MNHCDRTPHKHGKDRQDYQRWKCPVCGLTWSDNPTPSKPGVKPINGARMTEAERQRNSRANRKKKQSE